MSGDLEEVFDKFEVKTKCKLNDHLKNILILMGYSTFTLSKINESDLSNIELSLFEIMQDMDIVQQDYEKYLGPFSKKSEKFRFLPGHKSILMELIHFCKPKDSFLQFPEKCGKRKEAFHYSTSQEKGKK